jgi:hypothetical protein
MLYGERGSWASSARCVERARKPGARHTEPSRVASAMCPKTRDRRAQGARIDGGVEREERGRREDGPRNEGGGEVGEVDVRKCPRHTRRGTTQVTGRKRAGPVDARVRHTCLLPGPNHPPRLSRPSLPSAPSAPRSRLPRLSRLSLPSALSASRSRSPSRPTALAHARTFRPRYAPDHTSIAFAHHDCRSSFRLSSPRLQVARQRHWPRIHPCHDNACKSHTALDSSTRCELAAAKWLVNTKGVVATSVCLGTITVDVKTTRLDAIGHPYRTARIAGHRARRFEAGAPGRLTAVAAAHRPPVALVAVVILCRPWMPNKLSLQADPRTTSTRLPRPVRRRCQRPPPRLHNRYRRRRSSDRRRRPLHSDQSHCRRRLPPDRRPLAPPSRCLTQLYHHRLRDRLHYPSGNVSHVACGRRGPAICTQWLARRCGRLTSAKMDPPIAKPATRVNRAS